MQKHVHLWYTAYTKSTKSLRDSGDILQIVNLIPVFNWLSRSLKNTTAKSNISDHTISVLRGTVELKITRVLPQLQHSYQVTTQFQLLQWKSCNYIIHRKVITTTDFANSNKFQFNPEVYYRVAGALTTVTQSWGCQTQPTGLKHGSRHCRQATSCYCCSPKGCNSLDHASLVNWMSGINHKSKHYLGNKEAVCAHTITSLAHKLKLMFFHVHISIWGNGSHCWDHIRCR